MVDIAMLDMWTGNYNKRTYDSGDLGLREIHLRMSCLEFFEGLGRDLTVKYIDRAKLYTPPSSSFHQKLAFPIARGGMRNQGRVTWWKANLLLIIKLQKDPALASDIHTGRYTYHHFLHHTSIKRI
jgi:hypothetical protein